jgi:predicted adenylyl cyclase CyaB
LRRDVPVPDGPIPAPGKTKVRLTWKGPLEYDDGIRSRPELEVAVSGFATTADILSQLGFRETRQLSKRRETWHLPDVEVALDTLAFGKFVELEGKERPIIHQTARLLGLDPNQGLEKSYLQLAEERATTGEKPPPG